MSKLRQLTMQVLIYLNTLSPGVMYILKDKTDVGTSPDIKDSLINPVSTCEMYLV